MIPAILSCIYVIYLYRKLNQRGSNALADVAPESISDRVAKIQRRIDSISKGTDA